MVTEAKINPINKFLGPHIKTYVETCPAPGELCCVLWDVNNPSAWIAKVAVECTNDAVQSPRV